MKKIKIEVTVEYRVDAEMTVSDEVFESLKYMSKDFGPTQGLSHEKFNAASNWLAANIHERDRCFRSYQIDNLKEILSNEEET